MKRGAVLAVIALAASCNAFAHEFWIAARPAAPTVNMPTAVTLHVGEFFSGELVGVTASHAESVRAVSAQGERSLDGMVPRGSMLPWFSVAFPQAGSHVLAYESHPSEVTLAADKFHAYLHDEGLDAIIRQREAAGTAQTPGRERFRRSAKTLLKVGGLADGASTRVTGQRFETVPLDDPLSAAAGDSLRFELRFQGQPRGGVLVKAWHQLGRQTTVLRATTDAQGRVAFVFPFAGSWMLNSVHMVAASGAAELDWDSFWSSLTFELQQRK